MSVTPFKKMSLMDYNIAAILLCAVAARLICFDAIPIVTGDESWYGVKMAGYLSGEPYDWRTGNGSAVNRALLGMMLALLRFFEPAFWILRAPAVLANLIAIGLAYPIIRKRFDKTVALLFLILFASLPIGLVHSRMGLSVSMTALACLVSMHFALSTAYFRTLLCFGATLFVHPTNIFVLPVLFAPFAVKALTLKKPLWQRGLWLFLYAGGFGIATLQLMKFFPRAGSSHYDYGRIFDLEKWRMFFSYLGRSISGHSTYYYAIGLPESQAHLPHDLLFWTVVIALAALGGRMFWKRRNYLALAVLGSTLATIFLYHCVAGATWTEYSTPIIRWVLWIIVPFTLSISLLLWGLTLRFKKSEKKVILAGSILCWFFLINAYANYFRPSYLARKENSTRIMEPKKMIYERLATLSTPENKLTVITDGWELYWPLRYLAYRNDNLRVIYFEADYPWYQKADAVAPYLKPGSVTVTFENRVLDKHVQNLKGAGVKFKKESLRFEPGLSTRINVWTLLEPPR